MVQQTRLPLIEVQLGWEGELLPEDGSHFEERENLNPQKDGLHQLAEMRSWKKEASIPLTLTARGKE